MTEYNSIERLNVALKNVEAGICRLGLGVSATVPLQLETGTAETQDGAFLTFRKWGDRGGLFITRPSMVDYLPTKPILEASLKDRVCAAWLLPKLLTELRRVADTRPIDVVQAAEVAEDFLRKLP